MECPSCALDVEGSPPVCPYCQYEFPVKTVKNSIYTVIAVLLVIAWLAWIFFSNLL